MTWGPRNANRAQRDGPFSRVSQPLRAGSPARLRARRVARSGLSSGGGADVGEQELPDLAGEVGHGKRHELALADDQQPEVLELPEVGEGRPGSREGAGLAGDPELGLGELEHRVWLSHPLQLPEGLPVV